ncbi:DUF6702 family protein [Candidatus Uabimicrobium sp. HlEnr_7]|uniref:DUF6702 family protein n=1 Tax=Candidatus Uabimicrobium helgolandensis TaxID=3095367 RepID=UPI003558B450
MKKTVAMILLMCATTFTFAHRYHFTISEVEWNSKNKCFEVGLRVDSFELENILSKIYRKKVNLDKTKDIDNLIYSYVKKRFVVKTPKGKLCPVVWIGKEISGSQMWLFFEVPVKEKVKNLIISNQIFFESATFEADTIHTPINIVNIRFTSSKKSLYFTKNKPQEVLTFREN